MSETFEFTTENLKKFEAVLKKYPRKRASLLPTLHLAQEQHGYISPEVEEYVAELVGVPVVDVREVVSFYTLYFRKRMGRHHIRVCTSLSCYLRGSDEIKSSVQERLGVEDGCVTSDGEYSWEAVPDCLGACEIAPMMQVDKYFEGNLTPEKVDRILNGKKA